MLNQFVSFNLLIYAQVDTNGRVKDLIYEIVETLLHLILKQGFFYFPHYIRHYEKAEFWYSKRV